MITKWEWPSWNPVHAEKPFYAEGYSDNKAFTSVVRQKQRWIVAYFSTDAVDFKEDFETAVTLCNIKYNQEETKPK